MKKCFLLIAITIQFINIHVQAQEYNFQNTTYYYRLPNDSLISSGLNLGQFNYGSANPNDSIFHDGIYFPASDCFGRNLWIRLRHVADDPNGTSVGINVSATAGNPCQSSIMIGGWAGFLYDFEIHADINLTGNRGYYLDALYPTSITVASLETLSGSCHDSEWLSFVIANANSTGWSLNSINFSGSNPNSDPAFSDTLAVYTTGSCFPPDGFSYSFPDGSDSISAINASSNGYSEFKMSAGSVSHFQYGYEFSGGAGGYQGMSMAFGSAPTFSATSTDVTCLNGNNGQIDVTINGGIGPFTYQWDNGISTGDSLGGLMAGTYQLTVTDQNGCGTIADTTLIINQPTSVSVFLDSTIASNVSCYGGNDGSIQQYAGGNGSLSYSWNSGAVTSAISNLIAGIYICTISDQSTCLVTYDTITQPPAIDISTTLSGNTITANETGATFQWINCNGNVPIVDSTAASITPSVTGDYKVAITKNGCTDTSACLHIIIGGVNEIDGMVVSVFPNPGSSFINLDFAKPVAQANMKLINALGQVVMEEKNINGSSYKIDVTDQVSGIYIFEMKFNDSVSRSRIVKN